MAMHCMSRELEQDTQLSSIAYYHPSFAGIDLIHAYALTGRLLPRYSWWVIAMFQAACEGVEGVEVYY